MLYCRTTTCRRARRGLGRRWTCLSDDDVPQGKTWLKEALDLFHAHERLLFMTGYRARMGAGGNMGDGRTKVTTPDHWTNIPFMFAYKLVAGPLFLRR
eukprot:338429-Prorocentrum_minimum.AAC.1